MYKYLLNSKNKFKKEKLKTIMFNQLVYFKFWEDKYLKNKLNLIFLNMTMFMSWILILYVSICCNKFIQNYILFKTFFYTSSTVKVCTYNNYFT